MDQKYRSGEPIRLYRSADHPCAYLDDQRARSLFVDPESRKDMALYERLIEQGFRRSGDLIYRPDCEACRQCISLRIPVADFRPRRNQRRIWKQWEGYRVEAEPAEFSPAHYALFKRYLAARHPDGEMCSTNQADYQAFIGNSWADTRSFAFYRDDALVAVAVTDILSQGLSAVYTFFEPGIQHLSPGVFTLLWQIEECKKRELPWLYLGYWIESCQKMSYKARYSPNEAYIAGRWVRVEKAR